MKTYSVLFIICAFNFIKTQAQTTITDYDGNVYNTVTIGTQVWIAENLKVTHYRNGDEIPNIGEQQEWDTIITGAYCNYGDVDTYGRLYNWFATTDERSIAPSGWHVPTLDEYSLLIEYLGGIDSACNKLRETGNTHWVDYNAGMGNILATNSSGFTALPGGFRIVGETFEYQNDFGMWWCSTEITPYAYQLFMTISSLSLDNYKKNMGCSVRLIRDTHASYLFVSIDTMQISASANSELTFNISSNIAWNLDCNQDWININNTSGTNDSVIGFSASENSSVVPRTAIIAVTGNDVTTQHIVINQEGAQPDLRVSTNKISLAATQNSQSSFEINSNIDWEISKDESWLEIDKTTGSNNATITITASANLDNLSRTAIITVSGNDVSSKSVAVTQEATSSSISANTNDQIVLFPIIVDEKLTIMLPSQKFEGSIAIINSEGKILCEQPICTNNMDIDMSTYSTGIYFVKIISKETIITQKIIKQ